MRNNIITTISLVVFISIILLPPIIHGYVYPNIGDDTAVHMNIFDKIEIGSPIPTYYESSDIREVRYCAYYIVGYPMDIINRVSGVDKDILFFWFNYFAFIGVGISLFFVFKNLIGLSVGLLALLIPIFASYGFLLLFYSGVIFEIINIGIILPFTCYFVIKSLVEKKRRYVVGVVLFSCLFAVFHSTGVYLPFFVAVGYVGFIIYRIVKKERISKVNILYVVVGIACGVVFFAINPIVNDIYYALPLDKGISGTPLLVESLTHYMSVIVLMVLVGTIIYVFDRRKQLYHTEKLTIVVFGLLVLVMIPAVFGLSPQPFRQGYDLAIFLSLVTVVLVGVVVRIDKKRLVSVIMVGLVLGGATINVFNWFGYNSAIEKVDIQAIDYVNTLDGETYSCSDNVDHWIYSRYVNKEYLPVRGDIRITRNVPMKSKVKLVEEGGLITVYQEELLKIFTDGDVEIRIYR